MMEFTAEVFSGVALLVSVYSLWQTVLKRADLRVFVPPMIRYASPYQNSIFEIFEIPLTVINEGARTGAVLSFDLTVTNLRTRAVKQFYSGGVGPWSMAKARGETLEPFAPMSLTGRTSQSETILFYARNDSTVQQIVEGEDNYRFELRLFTGVTGGKQAPAPLNFDMVLPVLDHRAFTGGAGSLPLHNTAWQPAGAQQ